MSFILLYTLEQGVVFHGGLNYRLYCYQVNYDTLFLPVPGLAIFFIGKGLEDKLKCISLPCESGMFVSKL